MKIQDAYVLVIISEADDNSFFNMFFKHFWHRSCEVRTNLNDGSQMNHPHFVADLCIRRYHKRKRFHTFSYSYQTTRFYYSFRY